MGPLFSLICPGVGILLLVFLWRYGKRTGDKAPLHFGLAIVGSLLVLFLGKLALGFVPSYAFEAGFGFAPPVAVTELQGRTFCLFDSCGTALKFRIPATLERQIIGNGFREISVDEFRQATASEPDWWQPANLNAAKFYRADTQEGSAATYDTALICYESTSGWVYFAAQAID